MKDKVLIFIIGIFVGLLIGGGFFLLKLDDYFKELSFYKHLTLYRSDESNRGVGEEGTQKASENQGSTFKTRNQNAHQDTLNRNRNLNSGSQTTHQSATDSLNSTMNSESGAINSDEIVVRKDQLIATKNIEVTNLSTSLNGTRDSVLQQISDIRDDKNNIARQSVSIEIWKSPINYKGYKMTRNKIVLFGISEHEDFKAYRFGDSYYLRLQQAIYKIDFTDDFRQFERVTDESIIARLKN